MSTKPKTHKTNDQPDEWQSPTHRKDAPGGLKKCMPGFFDVAEKRIFSTQLSRTHLFKKESTVINAATTLINALYDKLETKGYEMAKAMLDLSLDLRGDKLRDDKKTPKFLHDAVQAIWVIDAIESRYHIEDPGLVVALALSHDLGEEYGITPTKMFEYLKENGIKNNNRVMTFLKSFDAISKYFGDEEHDAYKNKKYKGKDVDGHYKDEDDYQRGVRENPYASVAKMFDRAHNLMTLIGVRDTDVIHKEIAKTMHYYEDTHLEEMCGSFPCHRNIYEMLGKTLEAQLKILRYFTLGVDDTLPNNMELLNIMPRQGFFGMPAGLHPLIATADRVRHPELWLNENLKNELQP